MFFNAVDDEMRKLFITDKDKHDILLWIIYQTNYQETYKDLKLHQCYISLRTLSEQTKVEYAKTQRIVNKLLEDGYISYVFKSKNQYKPSIIQCNFIEAKVFEKHQETSQQAFEEPKPSKDKPKPKETVTKAQNQSKGNKPLTRYHGTFNEHYKKYDYDELEKKLLKSQEEKRNAAVKAFREKIG